MFKVVWAMNLRILKKLSKRAAPFLFCCGDNRLQFPAERGENYSGINIRDRKGKSILYPHPLQGTIMVGGMVGYEEPEWHEETAWEALEQLVMWNFTEYDPARDELIPTRRTKYPPEVFLAANDMMNAHKKRYGRMAGCPLLRQQ